MLLWRLDSNYSPSLYNGSSQPKVDNLRGEDEALAEGQQGRGVGLLFYWIRGCFLFAVALHILLRRHAVEVVEDGGEVIGVVEAGEVSNFGDRHLLLGEEFGGFGESDVADITSCRLVGEFLEFAIEVDAAQTYLAGDIVGGEVGVAEVLVDNLDDLLEETLVGRLEFGRSDLLGR